MSDHAAISGFSKASTGRFSRLNCLPVSHLLKNDESTRRVDAWLCTDFLIDGRRIGLFRGAKNYGWGAGAWDPNHTPGVDFLGHNFLSSKNSG